MSVPSARLSLLRALNTLIRTCYDSGALDQRAAPSSIITHTSPAALSSLSTPALLALRNSILDLAFPLQSDAFPSPPLEEVLAEPLVCTRCGKPILSATMIGDGFGSGQRFAHPRCYDPVKYADPIWDDAPSTGGGKEHPHA